MKLNDLFTPEQFHSLSHRADISKDELEESRVRVDRDFRPIVEKCVRNCGAYTSNPELEITVMCATLFTVDLVLKGLVKQ